MTTFMKIFAVLALALFPIAHFAQGTQSKSRVAVKNGGSYLSNGAYLDQEGNPVEKTYCTTGWIKVWGSNPARYFCLGAHYGSGPLALKVKSPGTGYLENGGYFDENAGQLDLTYCSQGWVLIPGTSPARYSCSGAVYGSGPLALGRSNQGLSGYLESGGFVDESGKPVEKTYCSTGWQKVPNSDPARYTCAGVVSGSGPLNYPR
jgi:hypothetical protein